MAIIRQLKQLIEGTKVYPITKSNAVYDDTLGRLDALLLKTPNLATSGTSVSTDGATFNLVNPSTGEKVMPITNTKAVFDNKYGRLDTHLASLITYGTQDLQDGVSKLATGTIYVVYDE